MRPLGSDDFREESDGRGESSQQDIIHHNDDPPSSCRIYRAPPTGGMYVWPIYKKVREVSGTLLPVVNKAASGSSNKIG